MKEVIKDILLVAHVGNGEGTLGVCKEEWKEREVLWRADVLKDWIIELTELYSEACEEMNWRPRYVSFHYEDDEGVADDY